MKRRLFIRNASLGMGLSAVTGLWATEAETAGLLSVDPPAQGQHFAPLETVTVRGAEKGSLVIYDGQGRKYQELAAAPEVGFLAGGTLGYHTAVLYDHKGVEKNRIFFPVDTQTKIKDKREVYGKLLDILHHTLVGQSPGLNGEMPENNAQTVFINGKFYSYFVCWLRDHVHSLKGMKYFAREIKSGIDLYADFQREDGMIWDNLYVRNREKNWWDKRFSYGGFILPIENDTYEFKRIPVEADVEYLFVEGLYYTWKASGDSSWMQSHLDKAIKALNYCLSSEYRWSEVHQLIKRGFTIDTWDFQSELDTPFSDNDIMVVYPGKTRFGVMHGDNTGYAAACHYLAEMLEVAERPTEATTFRAREQEIRNRLDAVSWTGTHFRHHVPEDPQLVRDLGVDQETQVSLSNAYGLNRGISQVQAAAIIRSYQRIREEMPAGSPGEWYAIYPPFPKGFDGPSKPWDYMNGGVTPIVAGELAHGAFEHGFESYGVDILNRIQALARETENYLYCTYKGKPAEAPRRTFSPVSLTRQANIVYPPQAATFNGQGYGAGGKETILQGVPFLSPDPSLGFTALALGSEAATKSDISIEIGVFARSIYLLHTSKERYAGDLVIHYDDGSTFNDHLTSNKYGHWWSGPDQPGYSESVNCCKAWRSNNDQYEALYVYGLNHPFPEKRIQKLQFKGATGAWTVSGLTLSDQPVWFDPGKISYGIPDAWGAAAVVYALIEGLAGVKDLGVGFDQVLLAPRWSASEETGAEVAIKYEASGGYLSYRYEQLPGSLKILFTGNATLTRIEVLLPEGKMAKSLTINGKNKPFVHKTLESSQYLCAEVTGTGVWEALIEFN